MIKYRDPDCAEILCQEAVKQLTEIYGSKIRCSFTCIVCLAEYYGYKHIGADEVLRQTLSDFYKNDLIPGDLQY